MDPKIGLNVLYTDNEGNTRAAVVVGVLEQTEGEDEGKKGRTFNLARLSVFTEGGGLTSVGAEFDAGGKPGSWLVDKGDGAKPKAEKLEKPEPEVKPAVFPKLAPEVKPEPEVIPEVKPKTGKP